MNARSLPSGIDEGLVSPLGNAVSPLVLTPCCEKQLAISTSRVRGAFLMSVSRINV
jgi:hypothetical protein